MTQKKNYKTKTIGNHELKPETLMMSYGYDPSLSEGSVKPPVFLTSTFAYKTPEEGEEAFHVMAGRKPAPDDNAGGLIYSRFNHPNTEIVEDRLSLFERTESALTFSSGMGAISAVFMGYLRPGDVILHSTPLYGGTETLIRKFLPEFGIETAEFEPWDKQEELLEKMRAASKQGTLKMIFIETPANPTNDLVDFENLLRAVDAIEKETGTRPLTVCDNTLLGPIFQQVIPNGLDVAVYSMTKYIGGHSDLVAGAVMGKKETLKPIRATRGAMGLNLDPHTCWMISRSLETLTIRMERAANTGREIASWLANNAYIKANVLHPEFIDDAEYQEIYNRQCTGPGSTFAFALDIDKNAAFRFINALSIFKSAVSLGGSESLICHPASTTHSGVPKDLRDRAGVTDGLIRLSIGLEHPEDLIADLDNAMKITFGSAQKAA